MSQTLPSVRRQVGQLFVVGLSGTEMTAAERAWLRMLQPSGVILFRRNIEAAEQTTTLLRDATEAAIGTGEATPVLRAVDVEGGLVDRFRDLLFSLPSAAQVASTGRAVHAKQHGRLIGRAARLLGFNATFAPVLDLALPESLPVMRTRVYSAEPDGVVAYAQAFLQGLRSERVLGSGKHFPGLGGGTLDSHEATPHIPRDWQQLWTEDIAPYRALLGQLPLVMVSHASYPRIRQAGDVPASVSRFWISDVLRHRMGYEGLIISDDMEMGGILKQRSMEDAAIEAISAGTDLIEICKDPALIFRAYDAVLSEAERSPAFRAIVRRAYRRVAAGKARLLDTTLPRISTPEQIARIRSEIRVFATEIEAFERSRMREAAERKPANPPVKKRGRA